MGSCCVGYAVIPAGECEVAVDGLANGCHT